MSSIVKPAFGRQLNYGHPLAQGLVACYVMNEGCGDRVYDLSGNGNHGILLNMTPSTSEYGWNVGKYGHVLAFASAPITNNRVDCGTLFNKPLIPGQPMSVFAITNPYSAGQYSAGRILSRGGDSYFALRKYNQLCFEMSGDVWLRVRSKNNAITYGETQSVGMTWDGAASSSGADLFVNGMRPIPYTTYGVSNLVDESGDSVYIGNKSNNSRAYDGLIEMMYIFDRVLSLDEMLQLHQSPFCMFDQRRIWAVGAVGHVPYFLILKKRRAR